MNEYKKAQRNQYIFITALIMNEILMQLFVFLYTIGFPPSLFIYLFIQH